MDKCVLYIRNRPQKSAKKRRYRNVSPFFVKLIINWNKSPKVKNNYLQKGLVFSWLVKIVWFIRYHKTEALHKCLKTNNSLETKQGLKQYLWEGKIDDIIHELKQIQLKVGKPDEKKRNSDDPKVILDNYINH